MTDVEKRCCRCKTFLLLGDFTRCRANKDGLQKYCKKCAKAWAKPYLEQHRSEAAARTRQYYRDHREEVLSKISKRYRRNPLPTLLRSRRHAQQNRERYRELARRSRDRNRVHFNQVSNFHWHQRRARIRATDDGTYTREAQVNLYASWSGVCPVCGKVAAPTLDHIIPLSKGGLHTLTNLRLVCKTCNSSKGARIL